MLVRHVEFFSSLRTFVMDAMDHSPANTPEPKIDPDCTCRRCQIARELRGNLPSTFEHLCRVLKISEANEAAITNRGELLKVIAQIRKLAHSKTLTEMKFDAHPDEFTRELQDGYRSGLREALSALAKATGAISTLAVVRLEDESVQAHEQPS